MNVRFKKTNKGEVAILPRKEYEVLAAKAREADEAFGTARLVARARKQIADGILLIPKQVIDKNPRRYSTCSKTAKRSRTLSSSSIEAAPAILTYRFSQDRLRT